MRTVWGMLFRVREKRFEASGLRLRIGFGFGV